MTCHEGVSSLIRQRPPDSESWKDWWWGSQITFLVVALMSTRQITQGLGIANPLEELL